MQLETNASAPASHKADALKRFFALVEAALQVSAVIAALGYIYLRAHLNSIGVSVMDSLGLERYLTEGYALVTSLVLAGTVAAFVAAVILPVLAWSRTKRLWVRWMYWRRLLRITAWCSLIVAIGVPLYWSHYFKTDWAVGELSSSAAPTAVPFAHIVCVIFVVFSVAAAIQYVRKQAAADVKEISGVARLELFVAVFALAVIAFWIPYILGASAHNLSYFRAMAETKDSCVCGLLVLRTANDTYLWHIDNGFGKITVLPSREIRRLTTGKGWDIKEAVDAGRTSAHAGATQKFCP